MESEVLAYVVSNDGVICHLPVTSELLSLLEQLKQGGAKERRGGSDEGAIVGELVQVLKRAMHPPESLACEDGSKDTTIFGTDGERLHIPCQEWLDIYTS